MNCNTLINEYIEEYEKNEPIFIDDIVEYIMNYNNGITNDDTMDKNIDERKLYNNVKVILNRLIKNNVIKSNYKGVYYIPLNSIWGEQPLPIRKIVRDKYLVSKDGDIKGYVTGAKLFNEVGLTTQNPNKIDIATNEAKNFNKYENNYLNTIIRKPKMTINKDNYLYLQLFDLIENKDNINIEVDNYDEIIYDFIKSNNLDFEKIISYARDLKTNKVLKKILEIAR